MFDGGPGAEPGLPVRAWLATDDQAELIRETRHLARAHGVEPLVGSFSDGTVRAAPHPVAHTSPATSAATPVCPTPHAPQEHGVRRLVFAHIGRPWIRAIDAGLDPPFGEWGDEGDVIALRRPGVHAQVKEVSEP